MRSVAATVLACTTAGCAADEDSTLPSSSTVVGIVSVETTALDPTRLTPLEAVVAIRATGCFVTSRGTGAVVDNGLVLTSAHVISGTEQIEVTGADGVTRSGVIVHSDPDLDIALVAVEGVPERGLTVSSERMPRGQAAVAVVPDPDRPTGRDQPIQHIEAPVELLRPVSLETEDIFIEDDITRSGYEVRSEIVAGDSGAPIVVGGEIVAIIWARSRVAEDRAWATNVSSIRTQIADPATRTLKEADRCP